MGWGGWSCHHHSCGTRKPLLLRAVRGPWPRDRPTGLGRAHAHTGLALRACRIPGWWPQVPAAPSPRLHLRIRPLGRGGPSWLSRGYKCGSWSVGNVPWVARGPRGTDQRQEQARVLVSFLSAPQVPLGTCPSEHAHTPERRRSLQGSHTPLRGPGRTSVLLDDRVKAWIWGWT